MWEEEHWSPPPPSLHSPRSVCADCSLRTGPRELRSLAPHCSPPLPSASSPWPTQCPGKLYGSTACSPAHRAPGPARIRCSGGETAPLRLGLTPTVFSLKSHSWSQDLMKLRFLMSHHRKNSVRDKMIGKKWIYLERYTFRLQDVVHLKRREQPWKKHIPQTECGLSQKARGPKIWGG